MVEPFLLSSPQQSADSLMVQQEPVSILSAILSSRLFLVGLAVVIRLLLATSYCNVIGEVTLNDELLYWYCMNAILSS